MRTPLRSDGADREYKIGGVEILLAETAVEGHSHELARVLLGWRASGLIDAICSLLGDMVVHLRLCVILCIVVCTEPSTRWLAVAIRAR